MTQIALAPNRGKTLRSPSSSKICVFIVTLHNTLVTVTRFPFLKEAHLTYVNQNTLPKAELSRVQAALLRKGPGTRGSLEQGWKDGESRRKQQICLFFHLFPQPIPLLYLTATGTARRYDLPFQPVEVILVVYENHSYRNTVHIDSHLSHDFHSTGF